MQRQKKRLKCYRRLGYRVVVEMTPRSELEWSAYRPRMQTPAAIGLSTTMEAATTTANCWIKNDVHRACVA
jgi:hypothetical protein